MPEPTTITTRLTGTTGAGKAKYASPNTPAQTICTSYFAVPSSMDEPLEYMDFTLFSDDPTGTLTLDRISGDGDGNYAIYSTETGALSGVYIHRDTFEGDAPDEIPVRMTPGDEEDFIEADEQASEEADALLA